MNRPAAAPDPSKALDRALLRRVRDRDPASMERFFEHFFEPVYTHVVRVVRERALADDLVQEVFLRLHKAIDRLDPDRDPAPWVFTVAVNVVRDHWRRRARRKEGQHVDLDALWDQPATGHGSDPQRQLEGKETAELIERALDQLSPADREILVLRRDRELETATVAQMLDVSPEAVRQRLSRAIGRLGKAYAALVEGPSAGEEVKDA